MFYAYVLQSQKDGTLYYGSSKDPEQRLLTEHNKGRSPYTKNRMPWVLVYKESFTTRPPAVQREKFFKSGQGREYIKSKLKRSS